MAAHEDEALRITRLATKEGEDVTLDHLTGVGADRLAYVSIDWRGEVTTGIYVRNLAQIEAWGYTLSDVEQIVTAAKATPGDEFHDDEQEDEGEDFQPDEFEADED